MNEITIGPWSGIAIRISPWASQCQQELYDRVHAAGDEHGCRQAWLITKNTGRFGFGTPTYRDSRFDSRRGDPGAAQGSSPARRLGDPDDD